MKGSIGNERERISEVGLRILFLGYAAIALVYGALAVRIMLTPVENACNSGVIEANPRGAVFIGGLIAVVAVVSGYIALRPPRSVLGLATAVVAVAFVSYVASSFIGLSHVDWCNAFQG